MSSPKRLLAIYAHPDDESFTSGGIFAMFDQRGGEVTLVCATRGEAGDISDPSLSDRDLLGTYREGELRAAMSHVGVTDIRFLDYRDSGMAGSVDNDRPDAFVNADETRLVGELLAVIREIEPDFVFTFGEDGFYGHPDHVKIHHAVTHAVAAYIAESPASEPALYHNALSRNRIREMSKRSTGPFADMTPEQLDQLGTPDELITTVIDVSGQYDRKFAALLAHRTQFGIDGPLSDVPADTRREMIGMERLRLVSGAPAGADPLAEYLRGSG
jgi:N-acetyl-1-D-myo-inositol-2-amino-2-deoxy-alpha-D-glucopyranoside deacetylase